MHSRSQDGRLVSRIKTSSVASEESSNRGTHFKEKLKSIRRLYAQ